jgi:hypothetical protein
VIKKKKCKGSGVERRLAASLDWYLNQCPETFNPQL